MNFRVGKAPYKSHQSNVGYRGLLHRIFGRGLVIPRYILGSRHKRLYKLRATVGRPRKNEAPTNRGIE